MIKYIQHILVVGLKPNQDYLRLEKNYLLFKDNPIIISMFSTKDPLTLQIIFRPGISCLYNLIKLFRNAIKTVRFHMPQTLAGVGQVRHVQKNVD